MTVDDKIRDEKQRCDINREAANIWALSSDKIHIYEYFTGEEILPSKSTCSLLGKALEKQRKKQVDALMSLNLQIKLWMIWLLIN